MIYDPDKDEQYIKIYYHPDKDIDDPSYIDDILKGFTGPYPDRVRGKFIKKVLLHEFDNRNHIYSEGVIKLMSSLLRKTVNTSLRLRKLYGLWKQKLIKEDSMFHYLIMKAAMQLISEDSDYSNYAWLKLLYGWSFDNDFNFEIKDYVNNNLLTRQIAAFYTQRGYNAPL